MLTNCEHCANEVEDDEIGKCEECEQDGLCPDCLPHDFHRTDKFQPEEAAPLPELLAQLEKYFSGDKVSGHKEHPPQVSITVPLPEQLAQLKQIAQGLKSKNKRP